MTSPPVSSIVPNLESLIDAITKAGEKIQEVYDTDFEVIKKDDNSPVTKADLESNKILRSVLEKTGIPILSEEDEDDKSRLESEKVWIVDPLDGTQDFVNRTGEFTVLVGLVENQIPVMGLVYLPTKKILYYGEKGLGAFCYKSEKWEKISVRDVRDLKDCLALVSRHHLSDKEKQLLKDLEISKTAQIGSTLKVMEVAAGRADIYLTTTTKMHQWDTAASWCIISEAGGKMTNLLGNELIYNTDNIFHLDGLLISNGFVHDIASSKISVSLNQNG
jgi:3'(2'), 5'-bisphosphate nucleotidase